MGLARGGMILQPQGTRRRPFLREASPFHPGIRAELMETSQTVPSPLPTAHRSGAHISSHPRRLELGLLTSACNREARVFPKAMEALSTAELTELSSFPPHMMRPHQAPTLPTP